MTLDMGGKGWAVNTVGVAGEGDAVARFLTPIGDLFSACQESQKVALRHNGGAEILDFLPRPLFPLTRLHTAVFQLDLQATGPVQNAAPLRPERHIQKLLV